MPLSQIVSASIEDGAVAPVDLSSVAQYTGFKNRLINGAMVIDQRNAGASVTPTNGGTYTLDRWAYQLSQPSKFSIQQNAGAVTPPAGYSSYLGATSTSAYSILTGDYFGITQTIEGLNTADLAWGTASAATVTLSFWVRSSLTGTFGGNLNNNGNTRSYTFSYTINAANTWEQKSITIVGDTSGTWLTTNGIGIRVWFNLGAGATYSGTAGSWSGNTYFAPTGATSVVGTSGATLYITGVQLEKGVTATSFDYRPYGTELVLCQRYYESNNTAVGGTSVSFIVNTANYFPSRGFTVTKRATPTMTITPTAGTGAAVSADPTGFYLSTANSAAAGSYWTASAEL